MHKQLIYSLMTQAIVTFKIWANSFLLVLLADRYDRDSIFGSNSSLLTRKTRQRL
jgi:hypothetical protein